MTETTMSEQGLRDVDRWKDKIEVRLDNRQVFFLFFGSALVACLLFVLGVIVGKRLESRGRAAAPEIEDPLALLDKLAAVGHSPETAMPAAAPSPAPVKPAVVVREREAHEPAALPAAAQPVAEKSKPKPAVAVPVVAAEVVSPEKPKPRFTLQIGGPFFDRADAVAYGARFATAGKATIVQVDMPGKGVAFRVRLGEYTNAKDASAAKVAFEKQHNVIALVAPKSL